MIKYSDEQLERSFKAFKEERFNEIEVPIRLLKISFPEEYSIIHKDRAKKCRKESAIIYGKKYRENPKNKERLKKYQNEYCKRPEVINRVREYHRDPLVIARVKEYTKRPDVCAKIKDRQSKYCQREEVKAKKKEYDRKRYKIYKEELKNGR
jgi:hypothetical protein